MRASFTTGYNSPDLVKAFDGLTGIAPTSGLIAINTPVSELLLDAQALTDLTGLEAFLSVNNWISVGDGDISVSAPVVTRISSGVEFPSNMAEIQEQTDDVRVEFTVTDTTGARRDVNILYPVYPVATVASSGDLSVDVDTNSGVSTTPLLTLFEPVTPNGNWSLPSNITLLNEPSGVTLGSGSLQIDTTVVAEQTNSVFSVIAEDAVTVNGTTTTRFATKSVGLTVSANAIGIVVEPAIVSSFAGGWAMDDCNYGAVILAANYTGLTASTIVVQLLVNGFPVDLQEYHWTTGDEAILTVDIWNNGRTLLDGKADASFQSSTVVVQQLLTLSTLTGTSLSVTTNAAAPDAYPVNGVQVNGRDIDVGLTVADFESAQMQAIQSPIYTAPNGTDLGQFAVYVLPTVVVPQGTTVTVTYDLMNAEDESVILADQIISDGTLLDEITPARVGLTVFWRAKFRAVGLVDLDVDSDAIAISSGMLNVPHNPLGYWDISSPDNMTLDGASIITEVTDLSGNGHDLTSIDDPLYVPAVDHLRGYTDFRDGALVIPSTIATDIRDTTVFVVTVGDVSDAKEHAKTWLSLDQNEFSLMRNNNPNLGVFAGGNNHSALSDRDNVATIYAASSDTELEIGVDNDRWLKGGPVNAEPNAIGGFIGRFRESDGFRSGKGKAMAALVYDKVLTPAEIADVRMFLAQVYNAPAPAVYDLICEGDSITKGAQATNEWYSFPSQLQRLYSGGTAPSVRNSGVSGSQVETTGGQVIELLDQSGLPGVTVPRVVFFLWGNNDFAAGNTAAQLETEYEAAWAAIRAAHPDVKIGVGSVLPNQRYGSSANQDPFNARLAETGVGAMSHDFFIDTNAIPELNPPTVGTYFADTTGHLTDAGYGVLAMVVKAGIDSYLEGL